MTSPRWPTSLDPKYKGKIALNGDPLKAAAGFNGVVLAALANGGTADNIAPGVDFFKKLSDSGNLIPVDPNPATIASGQTPIVIDWTYNEGSQTAKLKPQGIDWKVVVPTDAPPVAAYYNDAINKDAVASRGRSLLDGVRLLAGGPEHLAEGLRSPGPACRRWSRTARSTRPPSPRSARPLRRPVQLTADQTKAATTYLTDNWKFITIK